MNTLLNVTFYSYSYSYRRYKNNATIENLIVREIQVHSYVHLTLRKLKIINLIAQQNGNNITVSLHNN